MPLQPFFSLDPLNPYQNTYDPANSAAPWGWGFLYSVGGLTFPYADWQLASQHSNNEIIIGYGAVAPSLPLYPSVWQNCAFLVSFAGRNVTTKNQYLLIFALRGITGTPTAQFFVGNQEVDSELLTVGQVDQHAILLDVPGDGYGVTVWIRLVSDNQYSVMSFQGMTCYLL